MPINKGIGYMGVAKQSALASAETAADYIFGVDSGSTLGITERGEYAPRTATTRAPLVYERRGVDLGPIINSRAYIGSIGMWLLGAMGSVVTTPGTPNSHAYASGALPYLSIFKAQGPSDAVKTSCQDFKVSELALSWSDSEPVELAVNGVATTFDATAAAFTTDATDERDSIAFLTPVGGTFKIDAVGATPATACITGGSIKIINNVEAIPCCGAITAGDVFENEQRVEVEFTVIPANLSDWTELITGTTTGSAPAAESTTGSFEVVFAEHGSGTNTLTIKGSKVAFASEEPDMDPANGPVELVLVGKCLYNATDSDLVDITLTNSVASY